MKLRGTRIGAFFTAFCGLATLSHEANAEEPRFIVDTYDIIGGCPDEAAFRAEVERRVHARTRAPMHVVVHVTQLPKSIDGTIDVIDGAGGRSTRHVTATQCSEIVSAAALVVALAIDDAGENTPTKPGPPPSPTGDVTPNVAPLTIDTTAQEREREKSRTADVVFRFGAQAALQTGVAPHPVMSVPLFVEIGNEKRFATIHVEPRARLSWTFAASSQGDVAAGSANFSWMSGALDLCPVRVPIATRGELPYIDLRVCGRFEVGRLSAEGLGSASARLSEARLWLGAGAPFNFRIAPRAFGGSVFLELEAGPRFALVRDRFTVGLPNANPAGSLVFQPPSVAFNGGIGAGLLFR